MKCVRTEEMKKGFGRYLQMAVTEPVCIENTHQPVAVLLAFKEYERLKQLEDIYWGERALEAEAGGYLGEEESMNFIREARKSAEA